MKYYCFVNVKYNETKEESVKLMYPRIKIVEGLNNLISLIKEEDTVVFDSVLELDPTGDSNIDAIIDNYIYINNMNVEMIFDRSPNCDSAVTNEYLHQIKALNINLHNFEILQIILKMQTAAYINIKDAMANVKKFSQLSANKVKGKQYGRPKGSVRDSAKAAKAKQVIIENSRDFNGTLSDEKCIELSGASRNMYYRYKKQLKEEMGMNNNVSV